MNKVYQITEAGKNELKDELENITNQYLKLSEDEQLKYASDFLYVCMMFVEEIDKITLGRLLATLNKVLFGCLECPFSSYRRDSIETVVLPFVVPNKVIANFNLRT